MQVGREVRPWMPEGSPQQCCRNCQIMLEAVENKALKQFDAKLKASIGHVTDCIPSVTPPGTNCSTPCSNEDEHCDLAE